MGILSVRPHDYDVAEKLLATRHNLVPRACVTLIQRNGNPVPLDKGNAGSGNEIARDRFTGEKCLRRRCANYHVMDSLAKNVCAGAVQIIT